MSALQSNVTAGGVRTMGNHVFHETMLFVRPQWAVLLAAVFSLAAASDVKADDVRAPQSPPIAQPASIDAVFAVVLTHWNHE